MAHGITDRTNLNALAVSSGAVAIAEGIGAEPFTSGLADLIQLLPFRLALQEHLNVMAIQLARFAVIA